MALPAAGLPMLPDSLPAEGSDGEAVPVVEGMDGAPLLGAGEGVDGTGDGEPPVLGMELPEGLLVGLGVDGAPPPAEFVLQPPAIRIAPMAMATSDDRVKRVSKWGVFIEMYPWSRQ